jgi:putative phage-type endonuclease
MQNPMRNTEETGRSRHGALQLVSTKTMSREEWLQVRKLGIGASDAAAAVGLSPYQSQLELWMVKTGRDAEMPKPDPDDESSPMYWGNILEPIVAQHYSKRTGYKVRKVNAVLQHPDADKHWMLANLDYSVVNAPDVQILECKTAGEWGARHWREGVPEYVQCQVQHQLAVTGKPAADVCVLVCGQEIRIHRIERDDELIARLIDLERRFWHYVETDTPPPADGSESSGKALKYLYPQDSGDVLDLSEDQQLCQVFTELLVAREDLARAQQIEDERKQAIQQKMGEASKVIFPNAVVSWKKNKAGSRRFLIHT